MAFRTLSIDSAAEIHVRSGQLTVQRETNSKLPLVDLNGLAHIVW